MPRKDSSAASAGEPRPTGKDETRKRLLEIEQEFAEIFYEFISNIIISIMITICKFICRSPIIITWICTKIPPTRKSIWAKTILS